MKRHCPALAAIALLAVSTTLPATAQQADTVQVVVETELGDIKVDIDTTRAPGTAANFLRYVDQHHYDEGQFHRTVTMDNQPTNDVKIEVIQARVNRGRAEDGYDPIPLERTTLTGLAHVDGAISMARSTPDSATSSFFICIGDQPSLDFGGARNPDGQGFAAFGHVAEGMDIVRAVQRSSHEEQRLEPPVRIIRVYRN